jgi:nucleolar protein 9
MSDLILSIATELLPDLPTLIQSPFSSHPIRVLLLLLSARPIPSAADSSAGEGPTSSAIRSKRSTKFAKSHGTNHAIVSNPAEEVGERRKLGVPVEFGPKLREFWVEVREKVGGQEVRAMGVEKVAGPCMQMLIELEAENGEAEVEGSLMDSALSGLVTELRKFTPFY